MFIAKCIKNGENRLYKQDGFGRENYCAQTKTATHSFYAVDDTAAVTYFAKYCGVPVTSVTIIKSPIDIKIDYLHEMGVLRSNATKQEEAIRIILATCTNGTQRDIKLHDLIVGNETVSEFIRRHEHILVQQKGESK
jgi:hypothetical protein